MPQKRQAAVLVPVFRADGALHIVAIRRQPFGPHAGEIAFPGGQREPGDASLVDTAVRETVEEIGARAQDIEILTPLAQVETRSSGFDIHPFLARIERPPAWRPQLEEVAEVLELPVATLSDPAARGETTIVRTATEAPLRFPCLRLGAVCIWGATYRILEPLLDDLARDAWNIG